MTRRDLSMIISIAIARFKHKQQSQYLSMDSSMLFCFETTGFPILHHQPHPLGPEEQGSDEQPSNHKQTTTNIFKQKVMKQNISTKHTHT